jgi:polysaccharide export outer membrane protein
MLVTVGVGGCQLGPTLPSAPPASALPSAEYVIGPGDKLTVFVWRNPELTVDVPVRPDGRISLPLIEDVVAVGKTPAALSAEIADKLSAYVTSPTVTVIPKDFAGTFTQQVRVIGEAVQPRAIPFRANMTVLDAMIEVGGLTKYAAGNRASIVRIGREGQEVYAVRLDSLIRDGKIEDNVALAPGDILIIPQSYF